MSNNDLTNVILAAGKGTRLKSSLAKVLHAKRLLGRAKLAVVLPGDAPLVRTETLKALITAHRNGNAAATILSAVLADPSGYGRVVRKSETAVSAIVEESQLTDEQRDINEINSAIYCFTLEKLWPALAHVKPKTRAKFWAAIPARIWPTSTAFSASGNATL